MATYLFKRSYLLKWYVQICDTCPNPTPRAFAIRVYDMKAGNSDCGVVVCHRSSMTARLRSAAVLRDSLRSKARMFDMVAFVITALISLT